MKTIIITEEQKMQLGLLLEDKEGKNLAKARHYLQNNGYSPEQSQKTVDSIRTDIPNSRLQQCKFILGVVRLYIDGQLSDGQSIAELNKTLKYIASDAHTNEYDNNLNNESLQALVNRFKGVAKDDLQQSMDKSNSRQLSVNQEYTIVPIDNAEEASKYGQYTSWCVTHQSNMYESYTNNGTGRFYFCLRNGFEKEPKVEGEGCPLDRYGLSMIAVSITMEGEVNTITCRWNHDMGGNDNIMTIEQLENLLGRNFYQTFKPYTREELHAKGIVLFDEVQELLDSGKKPEEVFDNVDDFNNGFAIVELNDKYNFINQEDKLLSNQWYDAVGNFIEGFAIVELNGKWNFINKEGKLLSNQWYNWVDNFREGFAIVELNNKCNFINQEGKLLSNQWYNIVYNFSKGFAIVELNGKQNYINQEGKLLSNQWFDDADNFREGFAKVQLNNKYNFISQEGKLLSNQWYNIVYNFSKGFAIVELNGKWNYINQEGKLLSNQWFDDADNFREGFAKVELNNKVYKINTKGEIVESKNRNKKTVIITERQKKKLKKAIAAQDQIGGKVNAGVMDAVVGGMCESVNEKCDKCGGDVVVQIHGEPVYICKDCGKYFGTMPFSLKEGKLNESFEDIYDIYDDYQIYDLLSEFEKDKRNGITVKQWNLIPAQQYHTLLKRYMASPEMARIPYNVVYNWFMTVVKNAISIEYITQLAGHTQFFPVDDVMDYFGKEINGYHDGSEYLESIGFYDWCKLPDGTDAWSDYGLKPLFEIINEYKPNASAEEILILINRCLDVVHWRGDLSSAFIQGGKKSCDYISNLKESIDYSKWLKQLKKRRDPGNIEENVENETKWNRQGQEWHNSKSVNENTENEISSSEVDLSSFNIKKKLNPNFWIDGHLDSRIRLKLLDIADDFINTLNIDKVQPVDIIMTGSLANFNWNQKFSDVDLHIVYDFNDIDENTEFIKQYFDSKKQLWNQKHKDLTIYGFNVELYVQDENEIHSSSGIYSLDKDTWLIEPERDALAASKVNKEYIKEKSSYYATKIDELCYQFKKAKNDEYKLRKIEEKANKLFDKIKELRKIGFQKSGGKELNNLNLVFKWLRRYGYLEKLNNLRTKCYDYLMRI